MSATQCPGCGEEDDLTGRPIGGDIEVTCGRCGAMWHRGDPRCRSCGRPGGVLAQQRMTRHPRGTLLSVIGVHQVRVCPDCDADVAEAARARHRPLPDGYRSRFVHGDEPEPVADPTPRGSPASKPRRSGATYLGPVASPTAPETAGPTDPTVRQAIDAFLQTADAGASLAMVMLGSHLGPATRLSALPTVTDDLAGFVDRTWGSGSGRDEAVAWLRAAFAHWREQEWIVDDPTAGLS